jgi:hypothetical protein
MKIFLIFHEETKENHENFLSAPLYSIIVSNIILGSCVDGNIPSGSVNDGDFLDYVSD